MLIKDSLIVEALRQSNNLPTITDWLGFFVAFGAAFGGLTLWLIQITRKNTERDLAIKSNTKTNEDISNKLEKIDAEIQSNRDKRNEDRSLLEAISKAVEKLSTTNEKLIAKIEESALIDQEQTLRITQQEKEINELKKNKD